MKRKKGYLVASIAFLITSIATLIVASNQIDYTEHTWGIIRSICWFILSLCNFILFYNVKKEK